MIHGKLVGRFLTGVAAVAAAAAMTGCEGGVAMTDAPTRSMKAELRQSPRAIANRNDRRDRDERAADADRDERAAQADDGAKRDGAAKKDEVAGAPDRRRDGGDRDERPAIELEIGDADPELYAIVHTPGIDLEFTEGLVEPPQGSVVQPQAPWAPDPKVAETPKPVIEDVWPDKGAASGGAEVVIRGKNLQPAQILFGLAPARIIRETPESVTVAVPPSGAGHVGVVVTNRDGNYAIAGGSFNYYN